MLTRAKKGKNFEILSFVLVKEEGGCHVTFQCQLNIFLIPVLNLTLQIDPPH